MRPATPGLPILFLICQETWRLSLGPILLSFWRGTSEPVRFFQLNWKSDIEIRYGGERGQKVGFFFEKKRDRLLGPVSLSLSFSEAPPRPRGPANRPKNPLPDLWN